MPAQRAQLGANKRLSKWDFLQDRSKGMKNILWRRFGNGAATAGRVGAATAYEKVVVQALSREDAACGFSARKTEIAANCVSGSVPLRTQSMGGCSSVHTGSTTAMSCIPTQPLSWPRVERHSCRRNSWILVRKLQPLAYSASVIWIGCCARRLRNVVLLSLGNHNTCGRVLLYLRRTISISRE